MPYIKQERRNVIAPYCIEVDSRPVVYGEFVSNCGELNYAITQLIWNYFNRTDRSYQAHNDIVGALDNVKDEWKRRIQNNYEDMKCAENGDVYV